MATTRKKSLPVLAMLSIFGFGLAVSEAGPQKASKRNDSAARRPARTIRTEGLRRAARAARATDRMLVRFRTGVSAENAEAILRSFEAGKVRHLPAVGVFRAEKPASMSLSEAMALLRQNPDVESVRPDFRTRMFAVPNDPFFKTYQYNLRNLGGTLTIGSGIQITLTAGADIKAVLAWDRTTGSASVVIAFLDTGVDMSHVELKNKVVSAGRDFVNGDMDATDDNWHGTWTAGIAAAETNNDEGIAGVAWGCMVLPVKVLDADGNGYYDELIDGLTWAADNGAKVVNLSLGGDVDDPALEAACKYAYDKGVVIVAAAGNDGTSVSYPAAYDSYVLAVAATDATDVHASFSNPGPQIDVAAPGEWILGPVPQWYAGPDYLPYVFGSGTSAAAPQVAGLAALIRSAKSWLTAKQVMDIIRYTADDVNKPTLPGKDDEIGYGRINMTRALVPYKLLR
ncbi:MAG TPA: S8 family peptidase [Terriglobales bacterium]|nr:S8 family peptidase [Terriglobales bacterium]